ncbi:MAG: PAS domain S-box protein, partial [Gallionella sp.]
DALAAREAQLNTLIESVPDSIQFKDGEGRWLIANEVCLHLFGLKGEEWRNLTDKEIGLLNPRLQAAMAACKSSDERAWEAGGIFHDEEIVVDPDGNTIHFDVVKVPLFDERNQRRALVIIGRDVTERKSIEVSLKESEARFRAIVEQSPVAISFSRDGYSVDVNAAHLKMFGYDDVAEVRGKPVINQIAPQCRGEVEDRIKRRIEGLPTDTTYETTGLRRDGTQFPLVVAAKRMVLSDGPISTAFLIDFTERAQMQQSIERIGILYKMLSEINSANIHIRERGQLFETACSIAVASGMIRMACISLLDRESGDVVHVAQAGQVEGYLDRLKINIYDAVSGNGPTGMAIKSGNYVACNDISSDPRMAPWRGEALKRGYRASIVFPLTQSGQIIGAFSLYFHDAGALTDDVTRLLGSLVEDISFTLDFIDESARREQAQNELRELSTFLQSALENERKRIARELHDELGQTMTALHFDLKWLHERIDTRQKEVQARLSSMQALIERTVGTVRRISEDLRPGMLDDLGLAAAIEHHAEKFAAQTGIACDLAMNVSEFDLSDRAATALFRIVQESLTNIARHSGASRATIRLQDMGDKILLIVQDNGRGLPDGPPSDKKTYGLMGMRERVRMLEGVMDIFNETGSGVRIETFIPKHPTTRAIL